MVRTVTVKRPDRGYRVGRALLTRVRATDPDGDELVYRFVFGDGSYTVTDQRRARHAYAEPGRYRVTVIAYDGDQVDRRTVTIRVKRKR